MNVKDNNNEEHISGGKSNSVYNANTKGNNNFALIDASNYFSVYSINI